VIEHGTRAGFQQHTARGHRGIEICDDCRAANNAYMATYMRENYDPAKRRARYLRRKELAA